MRYPIPNCIVSHQGYSDEPIDIWNETGAVSSNQQPQ